MIQPGGSVNPDRVDPFVLPAATGGRFLLLIMTTLTSSVYVYVWLIGRVEAISADPAACTRTLQRITGTVAAHRLTDWYDSCIRQANLRLGMLVAVMLVTLLGVSLVVYLVMPRWIGRNHDPIASAAAKSIAVSAAVPRLQAMIDRESSARRRVYLFIALDNSVNGGRAFGWWARYRVVLNVSEFVLGDVETAFAHELAHIRNRDVDLTYATIAVWWGFLAAVAVPFVVVGVTAPSFLFDFSWRLTLLLALLWVIRASVLRTRELYADARVGVTRSGRERMIVLLEKRATREGAAEERGLRRWVAFRNHPGHADRVATIRDGAGLFRLEPAVAAATGGLIGFGLPPTFYLVVLLWPDAYEDGAWLGGLAFGLLSASVLSGIVWRATLRHLAVGAAAPRGWRIALPFAGGLLAGQVVTPDHLVGSWAAVLRASPVTAVLAAAILVLICYCYVQWTMVCAAAWLSASNQRRAYRVGVIQSGLVVGLWLGFWFGMVEILSSVPTVPAQAMVAFSVALNPVLLLSIVWACGYPVVKVGHGGLATANYVAAAVLLAYALAPVALYGTLRELLENHLALKNQPEALLDAVGVPLVTLTLSPAAALAAVGALVVGLSEGGRRRAVRAVVTAGVTLVIVAIGVFPLAVAHLTAVVGGFPSLFLVAFGHFLESGSAGTVWLLLVAGALAIGFPVALLGSLVRGASGPIALPVPRSGRRRWRALHLLPAVVAVTVLAVFGLRAWLAVQTASPLPVMGQSRLADHLVNPEPGALTRAAACARLDDVESAASVDMAVTSGYLAMMARAVVATQSSDDPTLRALGDDTAESLWLFENNRATRGVFLMRLYCQLA